MQFERPVPGQSLTTTPKSAPYERPPEITDPIEALDYHLDKLDNVDSIQQAMFLLELGIDIVTLTEGILRGGVLEGIHSVDVGILMIPIIVELLITIADSQGAKYQTGMEGMENERATAPNRIISDMMRERNIKEEEMPMEEPQEMAEEEQTQPMGLMARRT